LALWKYASVIRFLAGRLATANHHVSAFVSQIFFYLSNSNSNNQISIAPYASYRGAGPGRGGQCKTVWSPCEIWLL